MAYGSVRYLGAANGGCWYCGYSGSNSSPLQICCEFDCMLHLHCLREAIARAEPDDRETEIIADEFRSRGLV